MDIEKSMNQKCVNADVTYGDLKKLTVVDFMMNQSLLIEYIDWIKTHQTTEPPVYSKNLHNNLEALFFMVFFELQDIYISNITKPHINRLKVAKLKEMLSLIIVRGEYHNLIHYIFARKADLNASKLSYLPKNTEVTQNIRLQSGCICPPSEFNPFMYPDLQLLRKCLEFAYKYYKVQMQNCE